MSYYRLLETSPTLAQRRMKRLLSTWLAAASFLAPLATADTLYRERDNTPMTGAMLEMMDAFGMVDKVGETDGSWIAGGRDSRWLPDPAMLNDPAALQRWQQSRTLSTRGGHAPWMEPVIPVSDDPLATEADTSAYKAVPGFFNSDGQNSALLEAQKNTREKGTGKAVVGAVDTSLLDGVWRSQYSEVLLINRGRFLWRDARKRRLEGYLEVVGTLMLATIPGRSKPLEFFYAISGNYLNVYDAANGRTFRFYRARR